MIRVDEFHNHVVVLIIRNSSLNNITAFRMAAKDITDGNYRQAAERMKQDLDKLRVMANDEHRKVIEEFIRKEGIN